MTRVLREVLFGLLCLLALAMAVVLVLVMSGRLVSDPAAGPASSAAAPETLSRTTAAVPSTPVETNLAATKRAPTKTKLTVTAVRGDSWLEVRRSSSTGKVLFSGILGKGDSQAFSAHRLWLRLGAAGNVELGVDGKKRPVPSGTAELTLPS